MCQYTSGKEPITLTEQLHVTLWYLGNKAMFHGTSIQFKLSTGVNHKVFYNKVDKLVVASRQVIKWPVNFEDTVDEFGEMAGFLRVVGAIDATHIKYILQVINIVHILIAQ